ncbi:hypothetical protein H0H87_009672 [Tephrocybe sp. NHM501043]|nr:hypothetical protein H0H87_009672 [Tephrocybe sp. NHM501043]
MSFFSSSSSVSAYKPQAQIRQEGFHPASDGDPFTGFLPDPFRKFPAPSMDFTDELASLIQHDRPDDRYHRPPHNIFDISAPAPPADAPYPTHFSQTLPALDSSLRPANPDAPPPSSFHPFTRHTPSPIGPSRSRSRSRPPSSGGAPPQSTAAPGSIGPARTTRTRRNNSVSGTSPPPSRPHAIVIPRSRAATVSGNANGTAAGWYMPNAAEFSLPTPDSLSSHHSLGHSHSHATQPNPYSPFSLSPPPESALHLPPVSALHSLHHQQQSYLSHHGSPHSLPTLHTNLHVPAVPSVGPPAAPVDSPKTHSSPHDPAASAPKSDKQALLANEKRRRRRESHNAVERRRRDNINEKISELATLIPECLLDVGSPSSNPAPATSPKDENPASPLDNDPLSSSLPTTNPLASLAAAAAASAPNSNPNGTPESGLGIVKANKGMILRKSVEYIRYLQQLVEAQGARNRELESELKRWRGRSPSEGSDGGMSMGAGVMSDMYAAAPGAFAAQPNGAAAAFNFGLPSMPEGEGEDDDGDGDEGSNASERSLEREDGMDVELEERDEMGEGRGRTRGVNGVGSKKPVHLAAMGRGKKGGVVGKVKEEGGVGEEMMVL